MSTNDRIWVLMARALSNEATSAEMEELHALLPMYPEAREQYMLLSKWWPVSPDGDHPRQDEDVELKRILKKAEIIIANHEKEDPKGIFRMLFSSPALRWSYAAIITIGLFLAYFLNRNAIVSEGKETITLVSTKPADKREILLPDGTRVTLNADSKLYYDKSFNGTERVVRLEGEAFFDVVKMPGKPFIVHAGAVNIRVLGTAFNVKCYGSDGKIEATLLRGKIELSGNDKHSTKKILMYPNQKMEVAFNKLKDSIVSPSEMKVVNLETHIKAEERVETSWLYDRMEFRDESFGSLAADMERHFGISIYFEDDKLKNIRFNGSFGKETVDQAFAALKKVAPFNYRIKGNEVYIKLTDQTATGIAD